MDLQIDSAADQAILSALRLENRRLAGHLMVRYYGTTVYRFCLESATNVEPAEDLTQESFAEAFSTLEAFGGELSVEGWLKRVAHDVCIRFHERVTSGRGTAEDGDSEDEDDDGVMATAARVSESLRRRLEALAAAL